MENIAVKFVIYLLKFVSELQINVKSVHDRICRRLGHRDTKISGLCSKIREFVR